MRESRVRAPAGSLHTSVAQLVECWSPKPKVVGSIPTWRAAPISHRYCESSKGKGLGNTNSQFGKMWIYNDLLKENKKINSCDYYLFENNWNKGLKMEYFKK